MSRKKDTKANGYKPGEHYIICARTGRKILASDARKEWTGEWVHKDEWEPKHPSLIYTKVPSDKILAPQPIRSEPADEFVDVPDACAYWDDDMVEGDDEILTASHYVDMGC